MIKNIINKFVVYGPKTFLYFAYLELIKHTYWQPIKKSYSQNQEDLKIDELLDFASDGFYVDIGAYNPDRFSNTKHFYLKGWHGINIEPDIYSFNKFIIKRPRDINLNIGIAEQNSTLTFYKMDTQTLSTFDKDEANEYIKQGYQIVEERQIPVKTLATVFDEQLKNNQQISFLSIDTEGLDMQVLKSNNWNKYKPLLICIESVKHNPEATIATENINSYNKATSQSDYLESLGYKKVYDNGLNSIYKLQK